MMDELRPRTRTLILALATGFGVGKCPRIPGTAGTVLGVLLYLALAELSWASYVLMVGILFLSGIWLCELGAKILDDPDPGSIVWDEIVGFLIAMTVAPEGWGWLVAGFVLFRLFDILKPGPVGWAERHFRGGVGIMMDDAFAGFMAFVVLQATWGLMQFWG